jgi:hypothetical protein
MAELIKQYLTDKEDDVLQRQCELTATLRYSATALSASVETLQQKKSDFEQFRSELDQLPALYLTVRNTTHEIQRCLIAVEALNNLLPPELALPSVSTYISQNISDDNGTTSATSATSQDMKDNT